jgi:hypothetical protein
MTTNTGNRPAWDVVGVGVIGAKRPAAYAARRDNLSKRAIVIFSDRTRLWYLFWLKRGFRHCWIALETERGLRIINPLRSGLDAKYIRYAPLHELEAYYLSQGMRVVNVPVCGEYTGPRYRGTCVRSVSGILGIKPRFWQQTPFQLFKTLKRLSSK